MEKYTNTSFVIKNLLNIAKKTNSNIKINDIEDAAQFIANIYGYKSWKEYNLNKESRIEKESNDWWETIGVSFNYRSYEFNKDFLKQYVKKEKINQKKSALISINNEIIIGSTDVEKQKLPFGVNPESLIITGSESSRVDNVLLNTYEIIKKRKYLNIKLSKDTGFENINYLNILIENIDVFFDVGNKKNYNFVWVFLIKYMVDVYGFKFNLKNLIDLTDLNILINLAQVTEDNNIKNIITKYLKTCLDIDIDCYISSYELSYKHYLNAIKIIKLLEYFKKHLNVGEDFEKVITNENDIVIKYNDNNGFLIFKAILLIMKKMKLRNYYIIVENIDDVMSKQNESIYLSYKEGFKIIASIKKDPKNLSDMLSSVKQVLFLNQNLTYGQDYMLKIIDKTKDLKPNLWFNKNEVLRELKDNDAIVLKKKEGVVNLNEYEIKGINLYETFY